jgi:hypothetical protein
MIRIRSEMIAVSLLGDRDHPAEDPIIPADDADHLVDDADASQR